MKRLTPDEQRRRALFLRNLADQDLDTLVATWHMVTEIAVMSKEPHAAALELCRLVDGVGRFKFGKEAWEALRGEADG
ncbi:MAG: hypothetical protein HC889_00605 [Synechococcaceae cyanobacterium SM1_2_3]|nr:hypothetical protein [Synechococcaceae cyanobacterium SM1_2_3]